MNDDSAAGTRMEKAHSLRIRHVVANIVENAKIYMTLLDKRAAKSSNHPALTMSVHVHIL